jgi:hypothetical protein
MAYTVTINTVPVDIYNLSITETIDQTLDYGVMELRNDKADSYNVGDYVRIINDGKTLDFIIEADVVMRMNKTTYKHRISLIELTKRLENFTDSRRKFTQPSDPAQRKSLYDVAELIRMTVPLEFEDYADITRLFEFSDNVREKLEDIEAPEFQFENKNLREMMNDIFEFANGIPRLKIENIAGRDTFVLDGDFYNELKTKISEFDSGQFANQKQININESASGLDSETSNQVGEIVYEPSTQEYDFKQLVSYSGLLDTDSAVMATDFGIVEIQKLEVNVSYRDYGGTLAKRTVDITDFVIEKQEYDILPTQESLFTNRFSAAQNDGFDALLTKSNTIFFTRYQRHIGNLYEPYGFFLTSVPNIERVIRDAIIYDGYFNDNPDNLDLFGYYGAREQSVDLQDEEFDELQYRIEYVPYYNSRNIVRKASIEKTQREMLRYYGQGDKVTSPTRALKKLFKTVQQMGNDQVQTSSRNTSYELGDYSEEGYILITKETFFNTNGATAKYLWSKNYQQISQYIGMNAEIRVFEIPTEAYKRNVILEHYIELSDTEKVNDTLFTDFWVGRFMGTFGRFGASGKGIHQVSFFNPYLYDPLDIRLIDEFYFISDPQTGAVDFRVESYKDMRILKPAATSASGNTVSFYFEFDSSKAAMGRIARGGLLRKVMDIVPYTDKDGTLDTYSFQLIEGATVPHAQNYPLVKKQDVNNLFNTYEQRVLVNLDSAEVLAQTFQVHIIPEAGFEDKFIVGKFLAEYNALWNPIYTGNDLYEIVGRDKKYTWSDEYDFEGESTNIDYNTVGNRLTTINPIPYESWALIKKDTKEIVFAVNQGSTSIQTVYFNFRRKRTGFAYEYKNPVYTGLTTLLTPFQLATIVLGQTSVYFAWNWYQNEPFNVFEVEYSEDGENWVTDTTTNFNYTFAGLNPGTQYQFRVRAVIDETTFSLYATANATTEEGAPIAPSNLTGEAIGQTRILLNWQDNSDNEYAFMVEASENSDMSDIFEFQSEPAGITSSIIQFLESNTTYYFRVKAIGNGGNSAYSNIVSVTTLAPEVVSTPTITGLSVTTNAVTFTVTNTYDQLVTIKANLAINPPSTVITTNLVPNGTYTHTISGLSQGTGYTLYVRAESDGFTPSSVAQASFTTQSTVTAPPAPSFINESNLTDDSVTVTWEYVEQADGYRVALYRTSDNEIFDGFFDKGTLVVTHDYSNLNPGTEYRAEVRSFNVGSNDVRAYSAITSVTFTTTVTVPYPAAPSNVQITRAGTNNTITWQDNSNNEDGFVVSYAFQGQFDPVPANEDYFPIHDTQSPNVTSYVHATFPGQGTYYYRVISYNENGNSITYAQASLFVQQ